MEFKMPGVESASCGYGYVKTINPKESLVSINSRGFYVFSRNIVQRYPLHFTRV